MNKEKISPVPQGKYVPATRYGKFIFTAGMTARKNGVPVLSGRVKKECSLNIYREAVYQAASNALTAAQNMLVDGEEIAQILQLNVYINAESDFIAHSKLADFATDYLNAQLGDAGISARAALGVATLPGDAPVEIQIICAVK